MASHRFTKGMDRSHFKRNQKGEANNSRKLDDEKVREIRRLIANGDKQYWIAMKFGVARSAIHCIQYGKTWSHVDG